MPSETVKDKLDKLNNETDMIWKAHQRLEYDVGLSIRQVKGLAILGIIVAIIAAAMAVIF